MSHATQRTVSKETLQDQSVLSASGNGKVDGSEVVYESRTAVSLELWVEVAAVASGFSGDFILESRLEGGEGWNELARITLSTAAIGTPPKAYASAKMVRGEQPLGQQVRGRYEIGGGSVTASMHMIRRE